MYWPWISGHWSVLETAIVISATATLDITCLWVSLKAIHFCIVLLFCCLAYIFIGQPDKFTVYRSNYQSVKKFNNIKMASIETENNATDDFWCKWFWFLLITSHLKSSVGEMAQKTKPNIIYASCTRARSNIKPTRKTHPNVCIMVLIGSTITVFNRELNSSHATSFPRK